MVHLHRATLATPFTPTVSPFQHFGPQPAPPGRQKVTVVPRPPFLLLGLASLQVTLMRCFALLLCLLVQLLSLLRPARFYGGIVPVAPPHLLARERRLCHLPLAPATLALV